LKAKALKLNVKKKNEEVTFFFIKCNVTPTVQVFHKRFQNKCKKKLYNACPRLQVQLSRIVLVWVDAF